MDNLYIALVHYPVVNKKNQTIGAALTTIDLHDIARASMTFGVKGVYVITPFPDQADLAHEVIRHWTHGAGSRLNPSRKQALELIRVTDTFEGAVRQIQAEHNRPVVTIATSARMNRKTISPHALKQEQRSDTPCLLIFGTAWGLADELINQCDIQLDPITGPGDYNHLSVRSAASIYLDRLMYG
ncbi:MAG: RNA methyltransferase [Desulfotignum sp.]|nr:RNA methyltransferase [Desulfotignum sp.]MCF8137342.1 RNA methyltransferase [Desulfotignum sp.]